jgi:hypothetical protein
VGEYPSSRSQQILADFLASTSPDSLPYRHSAYDSIHYPIMFAI